MHLILVRFAVCKEKSPYFVSKQCINAFVEIWLVSIEEVILFEFVHDYIKRYIFESTPLVFDNPVVPCASEQIHKSVVAR